jgi:F-type H+-transporting ATPase subunit delta
MAAVVIRYARALADVIAKGKLDASAAIAQLRSLTDAFQTSAELREVLESPAIPVEQKRKLLDALAAKVGVSCRQVRNFIAVLIDQERIALLPEITAQVELEINARGNRIDAEIVSARELTPEQRSALLAQIARLTGKTILPRYATDQKLIGGVKVRVGSTIYDGSVRGQLERMRRQLVES